MIQAAIDGLTPAAVVEHLRDCPVRDITLVTKVGFAYNDEPKSIGRNSTYAHVIERAEGCLRRLQTSK